METIVSIKYWLPCECSKRLQVSTAEAGETVTCPSCAAQIVVPSMRLVKRLEPVERSTPRRPRSRWSVRKAWMTAGLAITVASLLTMAVLWAVRPRPPDPSQLTLFESWSAWMALRQGLDRRVSWFTYQLIKSHEILRLHTYLCLAISVVGLAITLTAFVLRRNRIAR